MRDAGSILKMPKGKCYVHLGRFGDLMILMPGWRMESLSTGKPVDVVCSTEFSNLFDGCSYVKPHHQNFNWLKGVEQARRWAATKFHKVIVPKWWDDPTMSPPSPEPGAPTVMLMVRGQPKNIACCDWESYQSAEWKCAGFPVDKMLEWPLVFDRRERYREEQLRRAVFKSQKPKLLINLTGASSPFPYPPELMESLNPLRAKFEFVDLGRVVATRVYDLLGLYERASLLITSDTSTLHLAAASKIPFIAFINNGGLGSVPKGNCVLKIRYEAVMGSLSSVVHVSERCLSPVPLMNYDSFRQPILQRA